MAAVSRVRDSFFIVATSTVIDPLRLIQKVDDIFGVYDRFGDILPLGKKEQGLYYKGTMYLSHFELRINGTRPLFLSSNMDEDNILMTVDLTNPDIYSGERLLLRRDNIHILRSRLLSGNMLLEHIRVRNFGEQEARFRIELGIDADFEDIFEVRGVKRVRRGEFLEPEYGNRKFSISYEGLDKVKRICAFVFSRTPEAMGGNAFEFEFALKAGQGEDLYISAECSEGVVNGAFPDFLDTLKGAKNRLGARKTQRLNETIVPSMSTRPITAWSRRESNSRRQRGPVGSSRNSKPSQPRTS